MSVSSLLSMAGVGLALCSVWLRGSCGQSHITCAREEALTKGFGGQTWETHPTSATTALFCGAQSQLGAHQFLSVKSENFFKKFCRDSVVWKGAVCLHAALYR